MTPRRLDRWLANESHPQEPAAKAEWAAILESSPSYARSQLSQLTPLRIDGGVLHLEAADKYVRDYLRDNYLNQLEEKGYRFWVEVDDEDAAATF